MKLTPYKSVTYHAQVIIPFAIPYGDQLRITRIHSLFVQLQIFQNYSNSQLYEAHNL